MGDRLRDARKAARLTQAVVAQRIGVLRPTYAKWERGDDVPSGRALGLLGVVLNVNLLWLIGIREDRSRGQFLKDDERALLKIYRSLSPSGKEAFRQMGEEALKLERQTASDKRQTCED